MKDLENISNRLVSDAYQLHLQGVRRYIFHRVEDWETAQDLAQDVFVRLLTYKSMLCEETVKSFIFTIASNLVTDYLRRFRLKQEYSSYIYDAQEAYAEDTDSPIQVKELLSLERYKLNQLPPRRRKIYMMNRFREMTASEIASELFLSVRTVENCLYAGRKEVREYIRHCI